jgi:hypothetical protein
MTRRLPVARHGQFQGRSCWSGRSSASVARSSSPAPYAVYGVAVAKRCGRYPSGSVPSGHRRQCRRVRNLPSTGLYHHASSRSDRRHEH